jgi:hypothetical protein
MSTCQSATMATARNIQRRQAVHECQGSAGEIALGAGSISWGARAAGATPSSWAWGSCGSGMAHSFAGAGDGAAPHSGHTLFAGRPARL